MYFRLICRDKLTFAIIDKIATMSENADDCLAEDVIMQRQFRTPRFPPTALHRTSSTPRAPTHTSTSWLPTPLPRPRLLRQGREVRLDPTGRAGDVEAAVVQHVLRKKLGHVQQAARSS